MAFTPKAWKDGEAGGTPLNAAALIDLEERVTDYADAQVTAEREAREAADAALVPKSVVNAKGDLLVGTANDAVGRLAVGSNGQVLTADSSHASGLKWTTPASGSSPSNFAVAVYDSDAEAWPERPEADVVMWMGPKSAGDPEERQDIDLRLEWEV